MTAVFFSERYFNIDNVYSEESKRRLAEQLTFIAPIKSEKELEARKEETAKVDYIFSTWGMPALSKEEIQRYFPNLKHVFYAAGSVQSFARPFLELGIAVHSAWRANGIPVAEVTVSEIILAGKGHEDYQVIGHEKHHFDEREVVAEALAARDAAASGQESRREAYLWKSYSCGRLRGR